MNTLNEKVINICKAVVKETLIQDIQEKEMKKSRKLATLGICSALFLGFEEVKKLILLDGGYLDLDKILPLDTELEETKNYIKSQIISDLDVLTSKEKSEAKHWSENMEKAVRQSYHWNVEYNRYELAINYENIEAILRLRRKIQAFKREVGDTLFISPRYPNEATWREEALKELPDYFDTIFLENFGHELYTQAPKEIASLMNEWLAYFL